MNRYKIIISFLCCFALVHVQAQQPEVDKGFVIVHSTKDYNAALQTVHEASQKLNTEIDLRGYYPGEESGLKTDFVCGCGEAHGYVARGRWDDGTYISIEYSDRYQGFAKGYYIVVLASGEKTSEILTETLAKAKKHYSDAYIKHTSVYIGCMH